MVKALLLTITDRFGKTVMANMIGAFFGKDVASEDVFETLKISEFADYRKHLNQYNTIYIDFSVVDDECISYKEYIDEIKGNLKEDLKRGYPDIDFRENGSVREDLQRIFAEKKERFVFVFDEWVPLLLHLSFAYRPNSISLLFSSSRLNPKCPILCFKCS